MKPSCLVNSLNSAFNGDVVVSNVQLYLDLASYKGRGEEAAVFILEQRLRS